MKQADLHVGADYAYPTCKPYNAAPTAARVRIESIDGHGKATVRVLEVGSKPPKNAWNALTVKRNEQRQINTRDIPCPWNRWPAHVAAKVAELEALAAQHRSMREAYDQKQSDRLFVDPDRALPGNYDERYFDEDDGDEERAALCIEYIKARGLGQYAKPEELRPLLNHLPIPVLRDILAAHTNWLSSSSGTRAAGTVAATFIRSADLLDLARIAAMDRERRNGSDIPQPLQLLREHDRAFLEAILDEVTSTGGELVLPPVPNLPDWVGEAERELAPWFGWIRLAVGDTSGQLLHSPGCRSVRSRPVTTADHTPWWQVMLEHHNGLCTICGGPGVRDMIALAGFFAASDVWQARRRSHIERWQRAALYRLLSATVAARARMIEPDHTLASRIVAGLSKNPPGREGWAAYAIVAGTRWNGLGELLDSMSPDQLASARALARNRLTKLGYLLPSSRRPLPLPLDTSPPVLRDRYSQIAKILDGTVPQLDRLLFTLPDT